MERLARLVMRHRLIVSLFWLATFVLGGVAAGQLSDRLTLDFSLPGQPGQSAEDQLVKSYGASTFDTYVAVVTVPDGQTVTGSADAVNGVLEATAARRARACSVTDYATTGDEAFIAEDGLTTYALIQGPLPTSFGPGIEAQLEPALTQAAEQAGLESGLTSYGLLSAGGDTEGPSVLVETLLGAAGALLVLIFVYASFLALLPLLIAAVSILTTFLLVLGLTTFSDVSFVVQFLISLIGLGVAIDYSLLLVSRWREERAHGRTQRGGRGGGDADRRARGPRLRRDGGHQPDGAGRRARAVPAQHGHRRHAHPAGQRRGRADPAAGPALQGRAAHRLPADPQGRRRLPRLDRLGARHRAPQVAGHRRGARDPGAADLPDREPQDRHRRHRLAGPQRSRRTTPSPRSGPRASAVAC